MDRPLVRQVISSPVPIPMHVSHIQKDEEGGLRFYLGPMWRGHYIVIQDEESLEIMARQLHKAETKGTPFTINHPPADKFYCERNGNCPCDVS